MNCPEDATPLDLVQNNGNQIEYDCSLCSGKFIYETRGQMVHNPGMIGMATLPTPGASGQYLRCPRDNDLLLNFNGQKKCQTCNGVWMAGKKSAVPTRHQATGLITEFMSLLIIGIGLFSWQTGALTSSADSLSAASLAPTRALIMVTWLATFMLLFTVPMSIYMQMVQAHRPHFRKAISHPVVTWIPIAVVILMALNVYFLTP